MTLQTVISAELPVIGQWLPAFQRQNAEALHIAWCTASRQQGSQSFTPWATNIRSLIIPSLSIILSPSTCIAHPYLSSATTEAVLTNFLLTFLATNLFLHLSIATRCYTTLAVSLRLRSRTQVSSQSKLVPVVVLSCLLPPTTSIYHYSTNICRHHSE
jgi:hypothetical protein